jgi:hypothetical protein
MRKVTGGKGGKVRGKSRSQKGGKVVGRIRTVKTAKSKDITTRI